MAKAELKKKVKARSVTRRYAKKIINNTEKLLKENGEEEADRLLTSKEILLEQPAELKEVDK